MATLLEAPFPWFGGKRRVAAEVWARFGAVANYVEPFFGSGAVLLGRQLPFEGQETVNDLDGFIANFWRSIKLSPEATAAAADHPVFENDLHARHIWLVHQRETLRAQLEGDPDWHDPGTTRRSRAGGRGGSVAGSAVASARARGPGRSTRLANSSTSAPPGKA